MCSSLYQAPSEFLIKHYSFYCYFIHNYHQSLQINDKIKSNTKCTVGYPFVKFPYHKGAVHLFWYGYKPLSDQLNRLQSLFTYLYISL